MKEDRHAVGFRAGETPIAPPSDGHLDAAREGIPLLLLPEGVLFDVDVSMLLGSEPPSDALPGPAEGGVRRIINSLSRLWLRQWE